MVENRLDVLVANAGVSRNSNAGAITILDGVWETNAAGSLAMLSFQYEEMGPRVRGGGCHF
jgi:NADP-dependent 3-hydroxy acid dehydrogenase YdfG